MSSPKSISIFNQLESSWHHKIVILSLPSPLQLAVRMLIPIPLEFRYGELDTVMQKILLESPAALATANIGNPLLEGTPMPSTESPGVADRELMKYKPVAGGDGMFSYQRAA